MKLLLSVGLKGGVGKTTVAVQTAHALTRKGFRVGILDLDYRTPNVPIMMDGGATRLDHTYNGDVLIPPTIDEIKVMSMAYIWPDWKCVMVEDSDAMEDVFHLLSPGIVDWDNRDFLVVDTPPTSVGVVKVALEAENVIGALVISHASAVSKMDTVRTIDLFAEKRVPIIGLICNQSVGEDNKPRYDLRPEDIESLAQEYGIPFFINVPHITSPNGLSSYFDQVANAVLNTQPVILKVKEPESLTWEKLLALSKRLSGKKSS